MFGNQIEDPFSMVSDSILYIILMMICPFGVIIEFYLFLSFFQGERLRQQAVNFTDPPLIKDRKVSEYIRTLLVLYKSFILSHFQYCNSLLIGIGRTLNKKLEDANYYRLRTIMNKY